MQDYEEGGEVQSKKMGDVCTPSDGCTAYGKELASHMGERRYSVLSKK